MAKISEAKLTDFTPDRDNANVGTERGHAMIEVSVREDGAARSIVVDADNVIVAGNKTHQGAIDAGLEKAVVVEVQGDELVVVKRTDFDLDGDDGRARRYAYRDNRSGELNLAWDGEQLLADLNAGVDLSTMFADFELEGIIGEALAEMETAGDVPPQIDKGTELAEHYGVQVGQIWALGEHRLAVGDCTDRAVVEALMGGERADLGVTDPPYGVGYDPSWRGDDLNQTVHGETILNDDNFEWLSSFAHIPTDVLYVWLASYWLATIQIGIEQFGFETKYLIIWNKDLAVMGRGNYHWKHEPCLYMVRKGCKTNWQGARDQKTVWDIATIHSFKRGHNSEEWGLVGHSNQKPLECMERPILNNSAVGEIVYDGFLGSGTTLIACEWLGRRCRAIEIKPKYCAIAIQRWADLTHEEPQLLQ